MLLANDQARSRASKRAAAQKATLEDLRLISMGPMTQGDYLHMRLLLSPQRKGKGRGQADAEYQTSGAQQLAAILSQRGGDGAAYWRRKLLGQGG